MAADIATVGYTKTEAADLMRTMDSAESPNAIDGMGKYLLTLEEHCCTARNELNLSADGPWPGMTERAVDRIAIRRSRGSQLPCQFLAENADAIP